MVQHVPMSRTIARILAGVVGVIAALGCVYTFLWIFSSASLASQACNAHFSLFAGSVRCRQPYIAMLMSAALLAMTVWTLRLALRKGR